MNKGRSATHYGAISVIGLSLTALVLPISEAAAKMDIGISSTNYLGQGSEGRRDSYSTLDLQLDASTSGKDLDSRALIQSQIGLNDSEYRFIEIPELYISNPRKEAVRYTLGRKLVGWSALDETWSAGAFQSRFRWDYLHPQEVGNAGAFLEVEQGPVKFTAFFSPLFVPDRGAPLDFSDGRVRSISPWVVNPPYEIEIMRKQVPVRYEAKIPPVKDIVFQNSVGGQLAIGQKKGMFMATSYAYQPMSQLLMSYEGNLSLNTNGEVNATLYPRVAYHHLASMDVGYRESKFSTTLSFLADLPVDEVQPLTRTSQQVGNMFLLSPTLKFKPFGNTKAGGEMSLSYLRVFGEDPADQGLLADGVSSEFDSRYPYKNAFLFSLGFPAWRKLTTDVKVLLDLENPGTIVSWHFQYAPSRDWRLYLATDVLSSFGSGDSDGTDFIHRYRENDRVTGGVTYAF